MKNRDKPDAQAQRTCSRSAGLLTHFLTPLPTPSLLIQSLTHSVTHSGPSVSSIPGPSFLTPSPPPPISYALARTNCDGTNKNERRVNVPFWSAAFSMKQYKRLNSANNLPFLPLRAPTGKYVSEPWITLAHAQPKIDESCWCLMDHHVN